MRVYALRLTRGNSDAAEDLVQDACIKAFRADALQSRHNPRSYLMKCVKSAFLDALRFSNRRVQLVQVDGGMLLDNGNVAENKILEGEYEEAFNAYPDLILAILAAMDFNDAAVLKCLILGMSYDDIGADLNIPVGTVRSRIHRMRKRLSFILSPVKLNIDLSPDELRQSVMAARERIGA